MARSVLRLRYHAGVGNENMYMPVRDRRSLSFYRSIRLCVHCAFVVSLTLLRDVCVLRGSFSSILRLPFVSFVPLW